MRYFFIMLFLFGCSKKITIERLTAEEEFKKAYSLFENKKYKKAIDYFQSFFNNHHGSQYIDDAQFYISESYYRMKDYENAVTEFNFLINNFPGSDFLEMAYLRKAQSLEKLSPITQRDQDLAKKAVEAYDLFILRFPNSDSIERAYAGKKRLIEKLNIKELQIAKLYYRMGKYNSAIIYLNEIISKDNELKDEALLSLGDCYLKLKEKEKAKEIFLKVSEKYKKEVEKRMKKLK